jgi:hypothetical protein
MFNDKAGSVYVFQCQYSVHYSSWFFNCLSVSPVFLSPFPPSVMFQPYKRSSPPTSWMPSSDRECDCQGGSIQHIICLSLPPHICWLFSLSLPPGICPTLWVYLPLTVFLAPISVFVGVFGISVSVTLSVCVLASLYVCHCTIHLPFLCLYLCIHVYLCLCDLLVCLWLTNVSLWLTNVSLWLTGVSLWLTNVSLWLTGVSLWLTNVSVTYCCVSVTY